MAGPDKEPLGPEDSEEWDEDAPRSLLSTTWFRVVLVVLVVGAVAAVAVPYVMDSVQAPSPAVTAAPPAPVATTVAEPPKAAEPAKPEPQKSEPPKAAAAPKAEPAKPDAKATAPAKSDPPKMTAQATKPESTKAAPKSAPTKSDAAAKPKAKAAPAAKPAANGDLWVQVGAFRDAPTAKKVAAALKEKGYEVAESTVTRGSAPATAAASESAGNSADKYDVLVTGAPSAEVVKKLSAKGLSVESVRDGTVVRPSLPLRDAVTLSNDLRSEGFTVTVRRVTTGATATAPAPTATSTTSTGGDTLYRVRVGAFPDRAAATAAVEKLRELGYTPFIARGRE